MSEYPVVAELDPVRRLRVLAASVTGAAYGESALAAPPDQVWELIADMDTSMPQLFANFKSWQTIDRDGERLHASAVGYLGLRSVFDVNLKPGFCVMQDRRFVGGMAVVDDNGHTRFAVFAALRGPGRHLGVVYRRLGPGLARRIAGRLAMHL